MDAHFEDADGATITQAGSGDVVKLVVAAVDEDFGYTTALSGNKSARTKLNRQDYLIVGWDESSDELQVTVTLGDKSKLLKLKLVGEYVDSNTLDQAKRIKQHAA